jgi:hypothetical protein
LAAVPGLGRRKRSVGYGYGWYFWHSCWLQSDTGDHWCFTGEYDWMEPLRHFGWREYLYHSGWVFGVPMLV